MRQLLAIAAYAALFVGLWFGVNWFIHYRTITGEIDKYEIVKRSGDLRLQCMQAEMVAAVQLQANNESAWKAWRIIAADDCVGFR